LVEKLSHRLEVVSDIKGMGKNGCVAKGAAVEDDDAEDAAGEDGEEKLPQLIPGSESALETVSCLAHALGAMNYSDRCLLRLHDVVVVRKGLNTAISYHQVVRDCLTGVIEKARSRGGERGRKAEGGAAPEAAPEPAAADAAAGGNGKASAAAAKAVDEIEQVITILRLRRRQGKKMPRWTKLHLPVPKVSRHLKRAPCCLSRRERKAKLARERRRMERRLVSRRGRRRSVVAKRRRQKHQQMQMSLQLGWLHRPRQSAAPLLLWRRC